VGNVLIHQNYSELNGNAGYLFDTFLSAPTGITIDDNDMVNDGDIVLFHPGYGYGRFGRYAAFGDHLTADFKAQSFGGRVETGYRFGVPVVGVTPYAAVQAQSFRTPGYSEVDVNGGGFGLAYNSRTGTDTRSELGSRFDLLFEAGKIRFGLLLFFLKRIELVVVRLPFPVEFVAVLAQRA
jgi:uncharacterized protein YhjY with autotransporter beta-barrel domain